MRITDALRIAINSLKIHKLRTFLTMIGIIIGIASIIIIVAMGQGTVRYLQGQFLNVGNNTLELQFLENNTTLPKVKYPFTESQITAIRNLPEVENVITENTSETINLNNKKKFNLTVTGINKDYFLVKKIETTGIKDFNSSLFNTSKNTVILNKTASKILFGEKNPLNKKIKLNNYEFSIIGLYEVKNTAYVLKKPEIILSIENWNKIYKNNGIQKVTIQSKDLNLLKIAEKNTIRLLNKNRSIQNIGKYQALNVAEVQKGITDIMNMLTIIVAGIASISLLVGGIGIMNIMLVSVVERTKEIGIRKALGATRFDIILQFLMESIIMTLLGGIIGITIGVLGAYVVSILADWPSLISATVILLTIVFSAMLGILFGIIPARRAANMEPLEAFSYGE